MNSEPKYNVVFRGLDGRLDVVSFQNRSVFERFDSYAVSRKAEIVEQGIPYDDARAMADKENLKIEREETRIRNFERGIVTLLGPVK